MNFFSKSVCGKCHEVEFIYYTRFGLLIRAKRRREEAGARAPQSKIMVRFFELFFYYMR